MMGIWEAEQVDLQRCRAAASSRECAHFHQCHRKAVVWRAVEGVEGELGFCYQHDPVQQKKRRSAA